MCNLLNMMDRITPPFEFVGFGFNIDLDGLFWTFCIISLLDYLLGVIISFKFNETNSRDANKGIFKKVGNLFLLISVDVISDVIIKDGGSIRSTVALLLIGQEFISLLEHLKVLGITVPKPVEDLLKHLKVEQHKNITLETKNENVDSLKDSNENKKDTKEITDGNKRKN